MRRWLVAPAILVGLLLFGHSLPAHADGAWLDAPLSAWNTPGVAVPAAPPAESFAANPLCGRTVRPAETAEDRAIVNAGWTLFDVYESGWGVRIAGGAAGWDGMCRPLSYQRFVFVDGTFAGTISPVPMDSRSDGASVRTSIEPGGAGVSASFVRYTASDPLCCPSRTTLARYRIERQNGQPVLIPESASTQANS